MANLAKYNGVAVASIAKIMGVAKASLSKWNGLAIDTGGSVIDSYPESNYGGFYSLSASTYELDMCGQAFSIANSTIITSVKFYLSQSGSPAGNVVARLYAATGSVGSTATMTGGVLATSDSIAANTLATDPALYEFTFSTPYSASSGDYAVVVYFTGDASTDSVGVCYDYESPTHAGNLVKHGTNPSANEYESGKDVIFYLYGS